MQPIQRVAIVGAGNMGSGIAQKSAQEEFDVQMVDREQHWVDRGQGIIANFDRGSRAQDIQRTTG